MRGHRRRGELPTKSVVASCVITSCAITGANPEDVLGGIIATPKSGQNKMSHFQSIARARLYAAFALRALYEDGNWIEMAVMVGVSPKTALTYYSTKDAMFRTDDAKWWNGHAYMRVIEATEAFIEMEKNNVLASDKGISGTAHGAIQGEPATQAD